jgi:hypothetical protein
MSRFVTDSAGNPRGLYSTDTQFDRLSADQVASGQYSAIFAGINNKVTGLGSAIFGGSANDVSGDFSYVGGQLNLVKGDYAILFGFNNEVEGTYSFFVGNDNSNENDFLFGFGQNGNFYNGGNKNSQHVSILCSNGYNIGTPDYAEDAKPNGAVTMGGFFPYPVFISEIVKNANVYSVLGNPYIFVPGGMNFAGNINTIQVQSSQVTLSAEKFFQVPFLDPDTGTIKLTNTLRLQMEGGINNIPGGGTNLVILSPGLTNWVLSVNWVISEYNSSVVSGIDNVVVGNDAFGNVSIQGFQSIARVGDSAFNDFVITYTPSVANPNEIEINVSRTVIPPAPSYSGNIRAAAVVHFVQNLGYTA